MKENFVYKIVSKDSGETYHVSHNTNHWTCTCKSFLYRSHDKDGYSTGYKCKHIKQVLEGL